MVVLMLLTMISIYFVLLTHFTVKAHNRHLFMPIAFILLIIMLCICGVLYLLRSICSSSGVFVYIICAIYTVFMLGYFLVSFRRIWKQLNAGMTVIFLLFMSVLMYLTVFSRESDSLFNNQLQVFHYMEAGRSDELKHALQNIVLFIPVGMLFPTLLRERTGKWWTTLGFGTAVTVGIETFQFITKSGTFDIDDILANMMGTLIGYLLYRFALIVLKRKGDLI